MKRSLVRKQSKHPTAVLERKLWKECKRITRKRYGNRCYTCSRTGLEGSDWHTGHMWEKATLGAYMKYDLRILRPQCPRCNIDMSGMKHEFTRRMFIEIGEEAMKVLERDRQVSVPATNHYLKKLSEYIEI